MLACGFVYAVRQQVLAVDYGYKAEALRREREELLDEQRRLLLAVEENSSPAQLERAGLELGLRPARSSQIGGAATASAAPSEQPHAGVFVGTAAGAGGVLRR